MRKVKMPILKNDKYEITVGSGDKEFYNHIEKLILSAMYKDKKINSVQYELCLNEQDRERYGI